ncbi:hypothetical protein FMN52_05120 [Marinobacter sp. BW6]|uniref:DUF6701 domain-containing protein n=1 Tax=Marinobacter sp. BW6 TaxID=2592624 RepID=UPI0011DE9195|nr:DUF6701 domain-containing protein [Marinobacter sp. BW6]TYC60368.1 hypothetical protein FMN52_05120 [Marinobacter sp. BW6]
MRNYCGAPRHGLKNLASIVCLLLMVVAPQWAYAACSEFAGLATINEISEKDGFIEIKLLSSSVEPSEYSSWQLQFCSTDGKNNPTISCSGALSLTLADRGDSPWLIMGGNALGNTDINLAGMDARLSDAAGNTIDYVQVGNTVSGSQDTSCSSSPDELPFDTYLPLVGGESGKYARRLPDGTGSWSMSSGASDGKDTEGDTNEGAIPGPDISVESATVFQGQTASFKVTLNAIAGRDLSIGYQTRDSSATAGTDYSARSGTVAIPAGQDQAIISVPTLQSGSLEERQFFLELTSAQDSSGDRYGVFRSQIGVGTILPAPVADWHLDNGPWNGSAGEVLDASGNGLHGQASGPPNFSTQGPARPGSPGTCGYARFDSANNDYIEIGDQPALDLSGPLTISAWINPASFPRSGIRTIVSKDENFEFHINSSREIYWWWRTDNGRTFSFTTNGANLTENRWYHVAVVYEIGRQAIYIDGVESGSASWSGNLMTNNDPFHIGQDQFFGGRYFDGLIDEVTVFSAAFDDKGIEQLYLRARPCGFNQLDRFEVSVPATASVCEGAEVVIRALDQSGDLVTGYEGAVSLVTSSSRGNWSGSSPRLTDRPQGALAPSPDTDNDGTVSYMFANADKGTVSLLLENASADELTVVVEDLADGQQGRSGPVQFLENAFVIEANDTNGLDIVAERNHDFSVRAVRRDQTTGECGLVTEYDGLIDLKAWLSRSGDDPGGAPPELQGGAGAVVPGNSRPSTDNLTLAFSGGTTSFSLATSDVGQYRLNLLDDTSGAVVDAGGDPLPVSGVGGQWTIRPDRFSLTVTGNPSANNASGDVFRATGDAFELVLSALGAAGNTLVSYGQEGSPQGAELTHNLLQPAGGETGTLSGTSQLPGSTFSAGVATISDLSWNEVGILELVSSNPAYLGVAPGVSGVSGSVGRFVPDRFDVTVLSGELDPFCDSGAPFLYAGQPTGWFIAPELLIEAKGPGTYTTKNYTEGGFMKLTPSSVLRSSPTSDNSAIDSTGVNYPVTSSLQAGLVSVGSPGVVSYTFSTADEITYQKSTESRVAPFAPDLTISVDAVQDSDNVSAAAMPVLVNPAAPLELRYGVWSMDNVYGPEDVASLSMPFRAEFWNGTRLVTNQDDSCSSWSTASISDPEVHHSLISDTGTLGSGVGSPLTLQPNGTQGTDMIVWDVPLWLEDDSDGDGALDDPVGLATFGVYRGHDRVIYWQER